MESPPRLGRVLLRTAFTILIAALALQSGCSQPRAIATCEWVLDHERMTGRFEPQLSLVYMPEGVEPADYGTFVIGDIDVGGPWVEETDAARQYAIFFRGLLEQYLTRTGQFELVTRDLHYSPPEGDESRALRLDGKITVFDKGSGWMRWASFWLIFLQSGASDFQVEGTVRDVATGELILEFIDRRRHLGNTPFGPNPGTLNNDFVMKETIKQTARCFARFLWDAHHGLPPDTEQERSAQEDGKRGREE